MANLMTNEARSTAASRKKSSAAPTKSGGNASGASAQVLQHYQSAVQLVQQGKFEKALAAFEKLLPAVPFELVERCRMYITTCHRQIEKQGLKFETPEERYDYAVSRLNEGYFDEATEELQAILDQYPTADYAYYGLALIDSVTGRIQSCLDNLGKAIEINPKNRFQARVDNDFQNMVDDPRFTELLYPEIP